MHSNIPVPTNEAVTAAPLRLSPKGGSRPPSVRPFTRDDIPAVVALRHSVFRRSAHGSTESLVAYFSSVFLAPGAPEGTSLVHQDAGGMIDGFIGGIPLCMSFDEKPIVAHIATQLMVAEGSRGLAGAKLLRAFLAGPQDLSIADAVNDKARRVWESLGGECVVGHSLHWSYDVRIACAAAARLARSPLARATAYAARPLLRVADVVAHRRLAAAHDGLVRGDTADIVTLPDALPAMRELLARWRLRPEYDAVLLNERLAALEARRTISGPVRTVVVRAASGTHLGWFVYMANRDGAGEVVQFAARRAAHARVLAQLWHDAWRQGVVALTGRMDPDSLAELSRRGCTFTSTGPCTVAHSRHPAIVRALHTGDAFFSRLDGEWWLAF